MTVRVNEASCLNVLNDSTMCSGHVVFAGEQSSPTPCIWKSCQAVFPTKEDMERHRLQHLVGEVEEGSENLMCLMCGKSIPRNEINRHLLEHLAQRKGKSIQCLILSETRFWWHKWYLNRLLINVNTYFRCSPRDIIFALPIRDLKYILVNIYGRGGGGGAKELLMLVFIALTQDIHGYCFLFGNG